MPQLPYGIALGIVGVSLLVAVIAILRSLASLDRRLTRTEIRVAEVDARRMK